MEGYSGNVQIRKSLVIASSLSGTMSHLDKLLIQRVNRVVEALEPDHALRLVSSPPGIL
jgi:hypothetical protein